MIKGMLEKTSISSNVQLKKNISPPYKKYEEFAFGMAVKNLNGGFVFDLVNGPQIFEIKSMKVTYENSVLKNMRPVQL